MPGVTPERWEEITGLLGDALERAPDQRAALLNHLHERDPEAAFEVASLLEQHERPGEFLPALPVAPVRSPYAGPDGADVARGRMVGPYRIACTLGSGGMGTVYLAERSDGLFSKQVAVKLLAPAFAQAHVRAQDERELLARLDHPNIARLIDAGVTAEGWSYLVLDYVNGVPIDRYCDDAHLSIDQRLQLLAEVCAGVAHAHQRLVIHCDIKPENILVTADGQVKLLDFGIAKLLDRRATTTLHHPGTPTYASPEQLRGDPITTACDVYSIGVLAYVLLTGRWPYPVHARGVLETARVVLEANPVAASRIAGVPPGRAKRLRGDVETVLAKAVAKDPARRYPSVDQLLGDLDSLRRGFPVKARPDTHVYRMTRFVRRHRIASAASVTTAVTVFALLAVSLRATRTAERESADLRALARAAVFDTSDALATVPGTTETRKRLAETAVRYLDRLSAEHSGDTRLREELASAYIRVGRVQGGAFLPNLGDTSDAISSFRKAIAAVGRHPASAALARLSVEAHLNIAQLATDPTDGAPEFDDAIADGERELSSDARDLPTLRLVARAYHGKATIAHLTDNVPDHLRFARRALDLRERVRALSPDNWQDDIDLAREYGQHALASVQAGDAAAAFAQLEQARALLEADRGRQPSNQLIARGLAEIHSRAAPVLVTLGRTSDAAAALGAAIALLEPLVQSDPRNAEYVGDLATAWQWLSDADRARGDTAPALDLSRRALDARRRRAAQDSSSMFVPWGLATSLNRTGELLMLTSPGNWREAHLLFTDARALAASIVARAPRFNEMRKELAISYEGLASVSAARFGEHSAEARALLEQSRDTWAEVTARSRGDRRHASREDAVRRRLAQAFATSDTRSPQPSGTVSR